jgi:hypothetical protein
VAYNGAIHQGQKCYYLRSLLQLDPYIRKNTQSFSSTVLVALLEHQNLRNLQLWIGGGGKKNSQAGFRAGNHTSEVGRPSQEYSQVGSQARNHPSEEYSLLGWSLGNIPGSVPTHNVFPSSAPTINQLSQPILIYLSSLIVDLCLSF